MSTYQEILAQYDALKSNTNSSSKPKMTEEERMKKYFTTHIPDGVQSAQKIIRLLPAVEGGSIFTQIQGHSIQVDGKWQKFICPEFANNEPCPFCEARKILFEKGDENSIKIAKQYKQKDMFVVKLIERGKENDGPKFWRFNRDFTNQGVMDKIVDILKILGPDEDIADVSNGIDLIVNITRDQNGRPVVGSIMAARNNSPLTNDASLTESILANQETWRDVYKVKPYDYLELIVKGETPVYDKETKGFISKNALEAREAGKVSIGDAAINDIITNTKPSDFSTTVVLDGSSFDDAIGSDEEDLPF